MKSEPTKIDSDNDGIPDKYVERTMADKVDFTFDDPNPLESDVKRTALKRDLFKVKKDNGTSYGGDQGWFDGDSDDYCNGKVSGEEISHYGCGLIAMCNVLLYLGIDNEDYRNWSEYVDKNTGIISKSDYMAFVKTMSNYFILRGPKSFLGVPAEFPLDFLLPGSLEEGFNSFSEAYDWDLDSEWASESNGDDVYCTIKSMLKNDIPVILAYSADVNNYIKKASGSDIAKKVFFSVLKHKLGPVAGTLIAESVPTIYDATHEYKSLQLYKYENNIFKEDQDIDSHYVTVTEISEFSESLQEKLNCGKVMLKTSSWGKVLYIDYDDYKDDIDSFTNILEIY